MNYDAKELEKAIVGSLKTKGFNLELLEDGLNYCFNDEEHDLPVFIPIETMSEGYACAFTIVGKIDKKYRKALLEIANVVNQKEDMVSILVFRQSEIFAKSAVPVCHLEDVDELMEILKENLLKGVALFEKLIGDFIEAGAPENCDWEEVLKQLCE